MRATEYAGAGPTAAMADVRCRALRDLADGRFESWAQPAPVPALRIRALVHLGRHDDARAQLSELTAAELASWPSLDLVSAAFAASRVGPAERCQDLLSVVGDRTDPEHCLPAAVVEALCLMAIGHADDAQRAFARALAAAEASSPIAGAQVRAEMGRFHLGLGPDRRRSARVHLMAAAVCLRANRLPYLADLATAMLEGDGPVGVAGPHRGVVRPGRRWLLGYGLTAPIEVQARPGLRTLRSLLDCYGPLELPGRERAELRGLVDDLGASVPTLGRHLGATVTFDSVVTYQPVEPVRWALDPRPVPDAARTPSPSVVR